jgi:hypothetical protein
MNERRIRERLRDQPIPAEHEAEERSWELLRAAFEERRPEAPRRGMRPGRLAVALAAAGALAIGLALTPAGAEVRDWIEEVIEEPGEENAKPALTSLPAPGRLLVESEQGPWVVQEDGSRRLLGDYEQATWSPSGLYVAVTDGRQLAAVDPVGNVRWSDARLRPVSDPAWAPSGFRIAYRSGASLRVIAGDGTGDRLLAQRSGPAAPAWRPPSEARLEATPSGVGTHLLAYALPDGRLRLVDVDSRRVLWTTDRGPSPTELRWSADGERLLALAASGYRLFDASGHLLREVAAARRARLVSAAFAPGDRAFGLLQTKRPATGSPRSEVVIEGADRPRPRREYFARPGRLTGLAWSPDGEWLLVAWREADQWLFIRPGEQRPRAVANISRQFDPGGRGRAAFPDIAGWCCPP